jgi:hypothetical protein
MVSRANAVLEDHSLHVIDGVDVRHYKTLAMAVIQYELPTGRFPPHVDHCDDSFVFLTSLGCTATFMVKGPTMEAAKEFKLRSGDLLAFNASSKAAILHGVASIDEEGSGPEVLSRRFPSCGITGSAYSAECDSRHSLARILSSTEWQKSEQRFSKLHASGNWMSLWPVQEF